METLIYKYKSKEKYFEYNKTSYNEIKKMNCEHTHAYYELYYLRKGYCEYLIDGKLYHLEKGDIVLIRPYGIHKTIYPKAVNTRRNIIYFSKGFIQSNFREDREWLLDMFSGGTPIIRGSEQMQKTMESIFIELHNICVAKPIGYEICIETYFLQLLLLLQKSVSEESILLPRETSEIEQKMLNITGYINDNYKEFLTLNLLAQQFYISPHYLSHKFKSVIGMSITDYMHSVRIKAAQEQLRMSNKSVLSIGEDCGFGSNSQFRRVFQKSTGTSPINYRKLVRE